MLMTRGRLVPPEVWTKPEASKPVVGMGALLPAGEHDLFTYPAVFSRTVRLQGIGDPVSDFLSVMDRRTDA